MFNKLKINYLFFIQFMPENCDEDDFQESEIHIVTKRLKKIERINWS